MSTYLIIGALVAALCLWMSSQGRKHAAQSVGATERVSLGNLLADLPGHGSAMNVDCAFAAGRLAIVDSTGVLGEIPLDSIEKVGLVDKSTYSSRLTATRMAFLGVLSLAAPKRSKHLEYLICIAWTDAAGLPHETAFEFTGFSSKILATKALAEIQAYIALHRTKGDDALGRKLAGRSSHALAAHALNRHAEAEQLVSDNRIAEAAAIYTAILEGNPKDVLALRNRGICRHVTGNMSGAWDDMVQAAVLGDQHAKDYVNGKYKE